MNNVTGNILRTTLIVLAALSLLGGCRTFGSATLNFPPDAPPPHHGEQPHGKGPPPHAPAHGYRAKHMYRYYPAVQVYFDTGRNVYFYLEGGNWLMSASLPHHLARGLDSYVRFEMETDRPYEHFDEHRQKYPPGQFKREIKAKKKKKSMKAKKKPKKDK